MIARLEIFDDSAWQMSWGERAAVLGVLARCKPKLAIEIGTAEGAGLAQIVAYAEEVHSFDLVPPAFPPDQLPERHVPRRRPARLLPAALAAFEADQRNVDFVLVDGDHSATGVRRDVEDLLDSPAIVEHRDPDPRRNQRARPRRPRRDPLRRLAEGQLRRARLHPRIMFREERLRHELWGGLSLVLVDAARGRYRGATVMQNRLYPAAELYVTARELVIAREHGESVTALIGVAQAGDTRDQVIAELQAELAASTAEIERLRSVSRHHEELWNSLMDSWSWRVTRPVRTAKDRLRGRLTG